MENPEEILHSLEEFSKMKPKDIPRELEEYLCFVAKTGNPVYQWPMVKSLFREKLLSVITEFYESCPSVDIPPCPNVEMFNYDLMKNFILEKLDTFAAAPFTVQRICELLTTPRKEYNRIDKYMRALEKNILVVSTTEPGRRSTENGEGIMNGIESEHLPESSNSSHDINVEEMDESPTWQKAADAGPGLFENSESESHVATEIQVIPVQESFENSEEPKLEVPSSSTANTTQPHISDQPDTFFTEDELRHYQRRPICRNGEETPYVLIEPLPPNTFVSSHQESTAENQADSSVTITAVPAGVQQRRNSVERIESSDSVHSESEEVKPSNVEERTTGKEEQVVMPKEEITSTVIGLEPIGEPATATEIVMHESALTGQEELGIENISPENSSSSPETLQIDINTEQEKAQAEKVEIVESCHEQRAEKKESESNEWVEEVKTPPLEEECVVAEDSAAAELRDQHLDGIPLEQVEEVEKEETSKDDSLSEDKELSVALEEAVEKSLVPEEGDKTEDEPAVEEPTTTESEHKMDNEESPMEVDVANEAEAKKEEEPATDDQPTSTSDAATL